MLDIQQIRVSFGDTAVLQNINLSVNQGEIVCLLGPSGCGKTTLLRVIAGLEIPQAGDVQLQGQSILNVPVHQREFGLMFQDFALFPHLHVAGNIEFGLKMSGAPPGKRTARVKEVLNVVGLKGFEKRDITQLSGGERQRVALARSLAPNPRLLMLDEPLGSLDAALRERLVVELRTTIKRMDLTAIYVTHDQIEAFAIADRIAVMNVGRIEQIDTPEIIYRRPISTFVARFLRFENIFPVISQDKNVIHTAIGDFPAVGNPDAILLHPDALKPVQPDAVGAIHGIVQERVFMGDTYRVTLGLANDQKLTFKMPGVSHDVPDIGNRMAVQVVLDRVVTLDKTPEN